MKLQELLPYLNGYLNISDFEDYGPNGLQVEGKSEITTLATAVSASLATIEAAVKEGVDTLIVHHGLFWKGDPYPIDGAKRKKLRLLLENEISLLAYHLPLDGHPEVGNNWVAAKELGWKELESFDQIGVKGKFAPVDIEVLVAELEAFYSHGATVALSGSKKVSTAVLVSGGAYRWLPKAAKEQVDCFITGNFDEPAWGMAHEEKMHFMALGHSATERVGPRALASHIANQFEVPCQFLDVPNPF